TGTSTNFMVDDVSLDSEAGGGGGPASCAAPSDIGWASVSPASGSTTGGNSTVATVTFNSAGLAPGTYDALLCVESNDTAGNESLEVPVSLTVTGGGGGGPVTLIDEDFE